MIDRFPIILQRVWHSSSPVQYSTPLVPLHSINPVHRIHILVSHIGVSTCADSFYSASALYYLSSLSAACTTLCHFCMLRNAIYCTLCAIDLCVHRDCLEGRNSLGTLVSFCRSSEESCSHHPVHCGMCATKKPSSLSTSNCNSLKIQLKSTLIKCHQLLITFIQFPGYYSFCSWVFVFQ